ncbi:MAG: deoxyribose-phosphate aldolase [Kiritimatiellae bacterium]|nr:deoxyribose-phosphate aldolase [Kiritimatiellia bacterium]
MNADLASIIDHTNLRPDATAADIEKLCREAREFRFASVCVHPCEVKRCAKLLEGSGVKVCTVVGFPLGKNKPETILFEANAALNDGAEELDFVIDAGAFRDDPARAGRTWGAIVKTLRSGARPFVAKLIIECCNLTDEEKVKACGMASAAGFDFVKTSTGFGKGGATVADVRLMRSAVGEKMGVKAAGGIRTREQALAMVEAGASRLGCSCGVAIAAS